MPWINTNTDIIHKRPAESFYIGFDFTDNLSAGETIDVTKTKVETFVIEDMSEADNIVDLASLYYDGNIVIFKIQNGEVGKWYLIKVTITTSLSNVFSGSRKIKVVE